MSVNLKQKIRLLLEDLSDKELIEVTDYIILLKTKKGKGVFDDLFIASESTTKFWDNSIDDEVWNK